MAATAAMIQSLNRKRHHPPNVLERVRRKSSDGSTTTVERSRHTGDCT